MHNFFIPLITAALFGWGSASAEIPKTCRLDRFITHFNSGENQASQTMESLLVAKSKNSNTNATDINLAVRMLNTQSFRKAQEDLEKIVNESVKQLLNESKNRNADTFLALTMGSINNISNTTEDIVLDFKNMQAFNMFDEETYQILTVLLNKLKLENQDPLYAQDKLTCNKTIFLKAEKNDYLPRFLPVLESIIYDYEPEQISKVASLAGAIATDKFTQQSSKVLNIYSKKYSEYPLLNIVNQFRMIDSIRLWSPGFTSAGYRINNSYIIRRDLYDNQYNLTLSTVTAYTNYILLKTLYNKRKGYALVHVNDSEMAEMRKTMSLIETSLIQRNILSKENSDFLYNTLASSIDNDINSWLYAYYVLEISKLSKINTPLVNMPEDNSFALLWLVLGAQYNAKKTGGLTSNMMPTTDFYRDRNFQIGIRDVFYKATNKILQANQNTETQKTIIEMRGLKKDF